MSSLGQAIGASANIPEIGLVKKLQIACTATTDGADLYKCQVNNGGGIQKNNSSILNVCSAVSDQITVLEYIQTISGDLEKVKENLAEEKRQHAKLRGQLERGKAKFFRVSNVFQGRRYYLSALSNILVTGDAEAMCEIFGGYLVEIDSAEENQFIVKFLGNFTQYQMVLTGGSDEVLENKWINAYNKTQVKYINWYAGEPNGGRGENCLFFYKAFGLSMIDYICGNGLSQYTSGYLCEIPE